MYFLKKKSTGTVAQSITMENRMISVLRKYYLCMSNQDEIYLPYVWGPTLMPYPTPGNFFFIKMIAKDAKKVIVFVFVCLYFLYPKIPMENFD